MVSGTASPGIPKLHPPDCGSRYERMYVTVVVVKSDAVWAEPFTSALRQKRLDRRR